MGRLLVRLLVLEWDFQECKLVHMSVCRLVSSLELYLVVELFSPVGKLAPKRAEKKAPMSVIRRVRKLV